MNAYRESAKPAPTPPESRRPSVGAVLIRIGVVLGVLAGYATSVTAACTFKYGEALCVAIPITCLATQLTVMVYFAIEKQSGCSDDYVRRSSWSRLSLVAAWAPILLPAKLLVRLTKWIATGK